MILKIVVTVSERHAPPSHANTQLGGACLSETFATSVRIILSSIIRRILKKRVIYCYEEVRVATAHLYYIFLV